MRDKILVTGCGGMLGSNLYPEFKSYYDVIATDIDLNEPWLKYLDVREYKQLEKYFHEHRFKYVLHLAALTDLEYCEIEQEDSWATNALGTENIVFLCKKYDIPMVYISTAGIFDGGQEYYTDFDQPNPLSHYAKSKYYGEKVVQQMLDKYFIFRAGWMMGGHHKDKKFIYKILKQLETGKKDLFVVEDKAGTPTYTKDFAFSIRKVMETELYGLYNQVCDGSCIRVDVAEEMLKILNIEDVNIHQVDSNYFKEEYFAPRPASEKLINLKLNRRDINFMREWKECLKDYLDKYNNLKNEQ